MAVILLNGFSPTMLREEAVFRFEKIDIEKAKEIIRKAEKIESYIGHEATAQLINQLFNININITRNMYTYKTGDILLIFSLKKRLATPEDVKNVTANDISITLAYPVWDC